MTLGFIKASIQTSKNEPSMEQTKLKNYLQNQPKQKTIEIRIKCGTHACIYGNDSEHFICVEI